MNAMPTYISLIRQMKVLKVLTYSTVDEEGFTYNNLSAKRELHL
jgi:hypothetical protein